MFFRTFSQFSSSWSPLVQKQSSVIGATVAVCFAGFIGSYHEEESSFYYGLPQFLPQWHKISPTLAERVSKHGWSTKKEPVRNDKEMEALFEGQCLKRQMYTPALPYPAWNYNWDGRMTAGTTLEAFRAGVQSIKSDDTEEVELDNGVDGANPKPKKRRRKKKSRHIILVRHGQYEENQLDEKDRVLTPLGRFQARATGRRLAQIAQGCKHFFPDSFNGPCHIKAIHVSEMVRAKETAELIAEQMQYYTVKNKLLLQPPDPLLNETLPAPMVPIRPDIVGATEEIDANQERVEEAFRKYFYRDDGIVTELDDESSNNENDEFEVIVCHGNMIRYFLCRALQLPPEAWLRFSTFNCSITYLVIRPEGLVVCRSVGDTGHLSYDQTTFSGYFGLKW